MAAKTPRNAVRRAARPANIKKVDAPINQLKGEPDLAYRCFLLWTMQEPGRRSARAASRAIQRSDGLMRQWKKRWSWQARIDKVSLPDMTAAAIYRARYYKIYKLREIVEIEGRLAAPFLPNTPIPSSIAEEVNKAVMPDKTTHEADSRKKKLKQQHLQLVDGALGLLARKIAAGEIRCTMRDLPALLKVRDEMTGPNVASGNGALLVESVRVRQAKSQGTDLLEAMYEDSQEVMSILGALVTANKMKDKHMMLNEKEGIVIEL